MKKNQIRRGAEERDRRKIKRNGKGQTQRLLLSGRDRSKGKEGNHRGPRILSGGEGARGALYVGHGFGCGEYRTERPLLIDYRPKTHRVA